MLEQRRFRTYSDTQIIGSILEFLLTGYCEHAESLCDYQVPR